MKNAFSVSLEKNGFSRKQKPRVFARKMGKFCAPPFQGVLRKTGATAPTQTRKKHNSGNAKHLLRTYRCSRHLWNTRHLGNRQFVTSAIPPPFQNLGEKHIDGKALWNAWKVSVLGASGFAFEQILEGGGELACYSLFQSWRLHLCHFFQVGLCFVADFEAAFFNKNQRHLRFFVWGFFGSSRKQDFARLQRTSAGDVPESLRSLSWSAFGKVLGSRVEHSELPNSEVRKRRMVDSGGRFVTGL